MTSARSFWPRLGWTLLVLGALLAALNAVVFMAVSGAGDPLFKDRFLAGPLPAHARLARPRHRGWMIRNYALTFAAVTLRIHHLLTCANRLVTSR